MTISKLQVSKYDSNNNYDNNSTNITKTLK